MVQAGRGRGKINKQGLEVRLLDHNGEGAAPGPSVPSLERPDEGPAGDMVPLEVARSRLESQRVSGGATGPPRWPRWSAEQATPRKSC